MPSKILLPLFLIIALQSARAQISISDSLPVEKTHVIDCPLAGDNGRLTLSYSKDTVLTFHYANRTAAAGRCEIQADRYAAQGAYGPAPIWIDSMALTKVKLLVYDGYDWSEQPVWARIRLGNAPEIQFSGPTQTVCNGNARLPKKILMRRSPQGWVCRISAK